MLVHFLRTPNVTRHHLTFKHCRLTTRTTEVTTRTTDDCESQRGEDLLRTQVTTREVLLTTQVTTLDDIFTTHVMTRDDILTTLHDDQEITKN